VDAIDCALITVLASVCDNAVNGWSLIRCCAPWMKTKAARAAHEEDGGGHVFARSAALHRMNIESQAMVE
jgi:hypothetical protein